MGIVLHHHLKLIVIAHTCKHLTMYNNIQDAHLATLLFPGVVAFKPAEQLPSDVQSDTPFPKKSLDCLLDNLASEDPVEDDIEKLLLNLVNLVEISKDEEVAMRELLATLRANVKMELFGSYSRWTSY